VLQHRAKTGELQAAVDRHRQANPPYRHESGPMPAKVPGTDPPPAWGEALARIKAGARSAAVPGDEAAP
jgi:hypothetical protein